MRPLSVVSLLDGASVAEPRHGSPWPRPQAREDGSGHGGIGSGHGDPRSGRGGLGSTPSRTRSTDRRWTWAPAREREDQGRDATFTWSARAEEPVRWWRPWGPPTHVAERRARPHRWSGGAHRRAWACSSRAVAPGLEGRPRAAAPGHEIGSGEMAVMERRGRARSSRFFWFAVGDRKFWVGDAATVRDPNLIIGIVFWCGRLEIV